ncbi:GNAT family N-acetyltransferase [Magnetovirga frankeli]|uniref:GNAT family N-acetyltransferase n=1 Tax=Magnetovirga frankeli TaxID=947516 RepID=UPI0012938B98|nr:GNAT family N-acetyltransferase [gamma proteobacterium SS-5]
MPKLPDQIQAFAVRLLRLQQGHIEQVRQWRNHPAVAQHMLSQGYISPEQQQAWFERIQTAADRRYYLIHWRDQACGFASVTSTDSVPLTQAEDLEAAIYFAPDSPLRGNLLAFAPALALNDACFAQLPAQRLLARVKPDNQAALRFNQAMGYRQIGEENGLILLAMNAADYQRASQSIRALLNRPGRGAVA